MVQTGKIFSRYKALGYVSNEIPLAVRYIRRRKENLVVTCVGKAFHTYGCAHFALLSVSGQHPEDISCLAADFFHIYTAAGSDVYAWRRGSELKHKYVGHEQPVRCILPFGPNLITTDVESNLIVWDIKSEENVLQMEFKNDQFEITALVHPSTYLNKILLGSEQGQLHLLNIQSQSIIYTFKGWGSCVLILEQSPALDVVAIGLQSGDIFLHNIKLDETVVRFHQEWGPVSSISFRSDSPIMVSGTPNGRIVMWDLEKRKVFSQLLNAHTSAVTGLECLPSEPLMVSSSPDNSLKLWIFDMADGGARLLRLREGHSAPPSFIRFHGANGHNLLSAGGDSSLRIFNTITETFNKSLGRASYNRKASKKKRKIDDVLVMPPIVKFTSETTREKEWDSIAAIHLGERCVTTWSYGKLKMGSLKLIHERFQRKQNNGHCIKATPSSLSLTHCGNFVVVGYSSGHCDRFNIQSGIHRASYGDPAHGAAVRGVSVDSLNQTVLTAGADSKLKWWHFNQQKLLTILEVDAGVSFLIQHVESSLLGVALDDCSAVIVDEGERVILRKFSGHSGRIMDAAFSPDGRWFLTSAMDRLICTWDIPTGCLIDCFKVDSACTSMSFSPTGEILATTHVDYLGVYLWQNKTLYTHVTLRPMTIEVADEMDLPGGAQHPETEIDDEETEESQEQIENLATLSGLPASRWANLLNIDIIRLRNRPKDPPKAPAPAPFFLPTVPALDVRFDLSTPGKETNNQEAREFLSTTAIGNLLRKSSNFRSVIDKFKNMGPSALNYEITALPSDDPEILGQFLNMISTMLQSNRDLELAHAYLGCFLKAHGSGLIKDGQLQETIAQLQKQIDQSWLSLENKFFYNLAVIQALKNT